MYVDISDDDPTPVGTMTLCLICNRALVLKLLSYRDESEETVYYRAWRHVVHWPGGWHDPEPAVSSR